MRMDAYYYGFGVTGSEVIDRILSAVACAGKSFHHTDQWASAAEGKDWGHEGGTPADWIENAAKAAAVKIKRLEEEVEILTEQINQNGAAQPRDQKMITHAKVLPPEPVIPSNETSVIHALTETEALALVSVLRKAETNPESTLTQGEKQFVNQLSNETGQALFTLRHGV